MVEIPRDIAWNIGCGSCRFLHCQLDLYQASVSYHCSTLTGAAIEVMNLDCYCLNHKYDTSYADGVDEA